MVGGRGVICYNKKHETNRGQTKMLNAAEARAMMNQAKLEDIIKQIPKFKLIALQKSIEEAAKHGLCQVIYDVDSTINVSPELELYEAMRNYLLFLGYQVTVCKINDDGKIMRLWIGW